MVRIHSLACCGIWVTTLFGALLAGCVGAGEPGGDGDGDGDSAVDSEALKSSESEIAPSASPTGADLAGSKSDVGKLSNQLTPSLLSSCPTTSISWSQLKTAWKGNTRTAGSYICNGVLPFTTDGNIVWATPISAARVGSAQFTCSNGTWLLQAGATCDGAVIGTTSASSHATICSSADPVRSMWIQWYKEDLKRCADTVGLDWWVNNYTHATDCLMIDNYHGYGSKDACWRAEFQSGAAANGNSYREAQAAGHISAWDEAYLCSGQAYPWTSVSDFGMLCKFLP